VSPNDSSIVEQGQWLNFDIHGRVGVRVEATAPTARQLKTMLGCFATDQDVPDDIVVTATRTVMPEAGWLEHDFSYTDNAVSFPAERVQVIRNPNSWGINGPGELLTSLVPVLDRCLTERGVGMIHAATVSWRGLGVALPAGGGTGKTSVIAKLMQRGDFAFMGDDWAFLTADGDLLGFEKPMFIKPHHRPIYPHLFAGRRKPLVPKMLSRPIGKITTQVHPHVVKYPWLADAARRWSPEHKMVSPRRALPTAEFASSVPLTAVVYVERFDGARTRLVECDTSWMVDRLLGNFHIEMHSFSQQLVAALGASSVLPLTRYFEEKARVLTKAVDVNPCYLLRVPRAYDADTASDDIVAELEDLLPAVARPSVGVEETVTR
jgi:hypothetical protein